MESYDHAGARGAGIIAEVVSFGYEFDPFRINKYNPRGTGLKKALKKALEHARMSVRDIDCIFAGANSTQTADRMEAAAIQEVFGDYAKEVPVTAVKSMIGECYSVSGAMTAAAAVEAIEGAFIPPTINYQEPDPECGLNIMTGRAVDADLKNVMVVGFSPGGANTCMILRKAGD